MATACAVYKHGIKLGTGTIADGSPTISSWSALVTFPAVERRNVQVQITGAGNWTGATFNTQILTDGGSTLTMKDACPFVGA